MCKKSCNFAHFLENITDIMRKYISLIALLLCVSFLWAESITPKAQLPTFYSSLNNTSGTSLVTAVKDVCNVNTFSADSYSTVWTNFATTDVYPSDSTGKAGKLWDMYSNVVWTCGQNQCGSYSAVGDCYNREHSMPKSWFGVGSNPSAGPGTDMHHMYPTDGQVNNQRNNYPFGECANGTYLVDGNNRGLGRLGLSTLTDFTSVGTVWEPADQYKGDFARTYMYMLMKWCALNNTTYSFTQDNQGYGAKTFNNTFTSVGNYGLTEYGVALLMKWHRQDPVSQKEIDRNNAVQSVQGNRNPFIDYPYMAEYLWGARKDQTFSLDDVIGSFEDGFTPGVSDGSKNGSGITPVSADYYNSLDGKKDGELRSALTVLLFNHHIYYDKYDGAVSGTENWDFPFDYDSDGYVWDIYTQNCQMRSDIGSTQSCCCSGLNREHLVCQSTFGGSGNKDKVPQYADRHSLFLTDARTNQIRNDQPFGEVDMSDLSKVTNGDGSNCSNCIDHALGNKGPVSAEFKALYTGSTEDVYEPGDEYKGDIARAVLYMVIRYAERTYCRLPDGAHYNNSTTGVGAVVNSNLTTANNYSVTDWKNAGTSTASTIGMMFSTDLSVNYGLSDYGKAVLLKWHRQDKVSQKEIDRNSGVESVQGNRNPFVDYPYLVEYIWGEHAGETVDLTNLIGSFESAFVPGVSDGSKISANITITWDVKGSTSSNLVEEGTKPIAPSVENCSTDRVFVGWTTSSTVTSKPAVLYKSSEIPNATSAVTYYAVFADKETSAGGSTETPFAPSDFTGQGTSGTGSAISTTKNGVTFACDKGYGGDETRCYKDGVITISSSNSITALAFTFSGSYTGGLNTSYTDLNTTEWTYALPSQARFSSISVTTAGVTTYSDYGLYCSTLPNVTITFHKNDGSNTTKTQEVPQLTNTALEANTWSRDHYTFLGWATTSAGSVAYADEATINTDADLDLYAVWQEDPKYTVTFMNGTSVHKAVTGYTGGQITGLTNPTACEGYTFVGWSATQYAVDNTDEPSTTTPTTIPALNTTYYAVYSKTEGGGSATTNVLMEDHGAISGTFGDYTFAAEKNTGGTSPAYNENGKDGRLYAKNSLTISTSTAMTQIVFNLSSQGKKRLAPITASVGTIATQASGDETVTWTGSSTAVTFTVGDDASYGSDGSTKAGQLCFLSVDITTGSGPVTYYTTAPDCEPVVQPEYTVIFMDRGEKVYEETGVAGSSISQLPTTDVCTANTFIGWSALQYVESNTDYPSIVDDPTTIPPHDTTYYAVYSKVAPSMSVPTNDYKKITAADELTSAKYLVVADTSKLVAMSSVFSGYYPKGVSVTASSSNVINTEGDTIIWQVTAENDQLTLYNSVSGYLYVEQSGTYYNIKIGNNTTNNKFTYLLREDASCVFTSVTYPAEQLEYYQSKGRWTFFTSQGAPIYLYKQQLTSGELTFYSTEPTCQYGPMTDIDTRPTSVKARKLLIHGQLFILIGDQLYDITGQRVR